MSRCFGLLKDVQIAIKVEEAIEEYVSGDQMNLGLLNLLDLEGSLKKANRIKSLAYLMPLRSLVWALFALSL